NKDKKLGSGAAKEVCLGVDLKSMKAIAHATVLQQNLSDTEIRIHNLFKGCEECVQIHNLCEYKSKKDESNKVGIVMDYCDLGDLQQVYTRDDAIPDDKEIVLQLI